MDVKIRFENVGLAKFSESFWLVSIVEFDFRETRGVITGVGMDAPLPNRMQIKNRQVEE